MHLNVESQVLVTFIVMSQIDIRSMLGNFRQVEVKQDEEHVTFVNLLSIMQINVHNAEIMPDPIPVQKEDPMRKMLICVQSIHLDLLHITVSRMIFILIRVRVL